MSDPVLPRLPESLSPFRRAPQPKLGASPEAAPRGWRAWTQNLAICAAAGAFLALSGAMQTDAMPLSSRLLFWVPLMMAGAPLGHAASALVMRIPSAAASRWVLGVLLSVAIAAPITFVIWAYSNAFFAAEIHLPALPSLFVSALVISAPMSAIMIAVNLPGRVTHAAPAQSTAQARFLERLPPKLRGAVLYAVSAEDHYLRLHTSKGSDLILMRLADAIGELAGIEGAQTHRSWWVARDALENTRREGERVVLVLKGGIEAPVSRPNLRPLRAAGWF